MALWTRSTTDLASVILAASFCAAHASFLQPHRAAQLHHAVQLDAASDLLDANETNVLKRMQWWSTGESEMAPTDKYLLFTADAGGLNNIRIGWEMTGLVAQYTGRTLVLPPPAPIYLLDWGSRLTGFLPSTMTDGSTKTDISNMLNLKQLKTMLSTLTWAEFQQRTGLTWEEAMRQAAKVNGTNKLAECSALPDYSAVTAKLLFMSGDGDRREGFSCGEWYMRGGPKETLANSVGTRGYALLTHGFMWHGDAFHIAAKVVNYLGLFNYVALHARYNDFEANFGKQPDPQHVIDRLKPWLGSGVKFYIASDEPKKFAGLNMYSADTVMWADLLGEATGGLLAEEKKRFGKERWFKLTGPVEELICAFSKVFFGSEQSSFSGHIQAMRIQAEAPVTSRILNKGDLPTEHVKSDIARWENKGGAGAFLPLPKNKGKVFLLQYGPH